MKRVLYIAYFFPPLGGAGVQRTLKFVRYLPEFGWEATVLTGPASYWLKDDTLLSEVPGSVRVVRAPHWGSRFLGGGGAGTRRSASRLQGLRAVSRALLVPDAYVGWVLPAARVVRDLLAEARYDAVITTSSPDSAHLLGQWIHRRGVPWLADFRDPWTRRMSYAPPTPLHDRLQRRMERRVVEGADRVVVTSETTREDYCALVPGAAREKILTITNGYDEEDFASAEAALGLAPAGASSGGLLQLRPLLDCPVLHAGQLNPERPLDAYLEGLRLFLGRSGDGGTRADQTRTLFLGGHYDSDVGRVQEAGLAESVVFSPSRPHRESVAALLSARILLLLEQDSERGGLILPGKIFEYLRARRPILAVVPGDGAAARLVRSLGAGWVADPKRPETIAEGLERLLSEPGGSIADPSEVAAFERRRLTARLAGELDALR